jgi:hypothetical protein
MDERVLAPANALGGIRICSRTPVALVYIGYHPAGAAKFAPVLSSG